MTPDRFDRLENLVIALKESLEREIQNLDRGMQEGFQAMATRFDNQASRLDRHAALWQTGHRWSGRMDAWAERIDTALDIKDRQIAELRERIERLEKNNPQ
jgi:hypothetical protein